MKGGLVFLSVLLALFFNVAALKSNKNRVMVWICLEFCDETAEEIQAELKEIEDHLDVITAVSFEKYTLGPNSTLVDNHLTEVKEKISAMGVESWPLLSSYPHYPEFIDWMRTVFAEPQPFIDACVTAAKLYNYVGYNLDWEPTDAVTEADGAAYADFIGVFGDALHKEGLKLSVDVATWSPIWNYTAIAQTNSDYVISMGTYTNSDTSFTSQLDRIMTSFGSRAGVGLDCVDFVLNSTQVASRFDQIKASNALEIDLWSLPVPDLWWPYINDFSSYVPATGKA